MFTHQGMVVDDQAGGLGLMPRTGCTVWVSTAMTSSMRRLGRSSSRTNGSTFAVVGKEGFEVPVHLPREDGDAVGIEPGSGEQARERVEVCVFVGEDDGNGRGWQGHAHPLVAQELALRYMLASRKPALHEDKRPARGPGVKWFGVPQINAGAARTGCTRWCGSGPQGVQVR
jgi:hypothetical protein